MKFLLFGTGEYYQRFKKWLAKEEVVALLDNSLQKQHTLLDGREVLSPQEGVRREFDAVIIMSFHIRAMKRQLMELGVAEERIYHFYDLRRLIDLQENRQSLQYYGTSAQEIQKTAARSIALLSTDLALGGTAIALFQMADVLKKQGHSLIFVSMMDGPLRERLEACGISVVVDSNLQLATMRETQWLADFRLVLCNAINYYIFLSERNEKTPVVWWLHDSSFFYDGVDREVIRKISQENLTVFSVGPVPEKAIHAVCPDLPVKELLYGVADTAKEAVHEKGKLCFVIIGHIEERKGQDILMQALGLLEREEREKAVFYMVGQDTSLLAERIKEVAASMPEVVITGPVGREEIDAVLSRADVLICPSREDPMPTVAAEAMMHGVPCILSDATGTSAYIREEQSGLVFSCGNERELADKIRWCMAHEECLAGMGSLARKIYEEKFSMEVFEERVRKIVENF